MTNARPQLVSAGRTLRMTLLLPAVALIFLGSVFQLGMLGYGQLDPRSLWPVMMVFQSAWNLLTAHSNTPELASIARFWPLLLVVCGLGILAALRPAKRQPVRRSIARENELGRSAQLQSALHRWRGHPVSGMHTAARPDRDPRRRPDLHVLAARADLFWLLQVHSHPLDVGSILGWLLLSARTCPASRRARLWSRPV